jgi:hypothetical protein
MTLGPHEELSPVRRPPGTDGHPALTQDRVSSTSSHRRLAAAGHFRQHALPAQQSASPSRQQGAVPKSQQTQSAHEVQSHTGHSSPQHPEPAALPPIPRGLPTRAVPRLNTAASAATGAIERIRDIAASPNGLKWARTPDSWHPPSNTRRSTTRASAPGRRNQWIVGPAAAHFVTEVREVHEPVSHQVRGIERHKEHLHGPAAGATAAGRTRSVSLARTTLVGVVAQFHDGRCGRDSDGRGDPTCVGVGDRATAAAASGGGANKGQRGRGSKHTQLGQQGGASQQQTTGCERQSGHESTIGTADERVKMGLSRSPWADEPPTMTRPRQV